MKQGARDVMTGEVVLLRCWFDGVYLPVVEEVSVTESKGLVSASLKIPASPKLRLEELIGKKLHIFYATKRVIELFGDDPGNRGLSRWPILFQGELSGDSFGAGVSYRSQSLRFVGHSRHFDQTQLYFYDPARENELDTIQKAAFLGNKELKFETSGLLSKTTRLEVALKQAIEQHGGDDDRFIAYIATLRQLTQDAAASHASFRVFNYQLKLDQRFGAHVDPDVGNVLTLDQFATMVGRHASALPSSTPLMSVLEIASRAMRYEWLHISQPKLTRSSRTQVRESFDVVEQSRVRDVYRELSRFLSAKRLRFVTLPEAALAKDFTVGTLIGTFTFAPDYMRKEQRGELTYSSEDDFIARVSALLTNGGSVYQACLSVVNSNVWPGTPGEVSSATSGPPLSEEQRQKDAEAEQSALAAQLRDLVGSLDTLNEFVAVPRMTFSQPPRCNVIVPDKLEGWSMQRNFLEEITRLYASVKFTDKLTEYFIAPQTGVFYHVDDGANVAVLDDAFEKAARPDATVIAPPGATPDVEED